MTKINDNGIDRNMTADEQAAYEAWATAAQADAETQAANQAAKSAARESALQKLTNLGLTVDEIAALVGQ